MCLIQAQCDKMNHGSHPQHRGTRSLIEIPHLIYVVMQIKNAYLLVSSRVFIEHVFQHREGYWIVLIYP